MKNFKNNNGTAMDYFVGDYYKDELIKLLNLAKKHRINYRKIGENYLFESNYSGKLIHVTDGGQVVVNDKDYKAVLVIAEDIYTELNYGILLTNDDKKIKKFKAYVQANKLNDENNLELNTQKLAGRIFESYGERKDRALNGMYLD